MTRLLNKRVLIFDWDGTLFDSMSIKSKNFSQILSSELNIESQHIMTRYLRYSGIPRREIFLRIAKDFGQQLNEVQLARLSDELTNLNNDNLAGAKLFPDALHFLERVFNSDFSLYISSSVPETELRSIVARVLPEHFNHAFRKIMGTTPYYAKGRGHISVILRETQSKPAECVVFGDDIADVELSAEAGVECIHICRGGLLTKGGVASFDEVIAC